MIETETDLDWAEWPEYPHDYYLLVIEYIFWLKVFDELATDEWNGEQDGKRVDTVSRVETSKLFTLVAAPFEEKTRDDQSSLWNAVWMKSWTVEEFTYVNIGVTERERDCQEERRYSK